MEAGTIAHEETIHHTMVRSLDATDTVPVNNSMKKASGAILFVYALLLLFGVGTGYLLATKTGLSGGVAPGTGAPIKSATVVGVQDASTFKDCASGTLQKNDKGTEGTHALIREGGPSQTAYLVSSVIDMDQYVGQAVKVCGQTVAAKKVSWLMDVGRLELGAK
jgi:hypothetical protein